MLILSKFFINECPICKIKIDSVISPNQLSKNFVAADLASKNRELK